jgi:hypothetical protein
MDCHRKLARRPSPTPRRWPPHERTARIGTSDGSQLPFTERQALAHRDRHPVAPSASGRLEARPALFPFPPLPRRARPSEQRYIDPSASLGIQSATRSSAGPQPCRLVPESNGFQTEETLGALSGFDAKVREGHHLDDLDWSLGMRRVQVLQLDAYQRPVHTVPWRPGALSRNVAEPSLVRRGFR